MLEFVLQGLGNGSSFPPRGVTCIIDNGRNISNEVRVRTEKVYTEEVPTSMHACTVNLTNAVEMFKLPNIHAWQACTH